MKRHVTAVALVVLIGLALVPQATAAAQNSETTLVTDSGSLVLNATSGQVIRGQSDLPAGTTLSVRMKSISRGSIFIRTAEATVGTDGHFRAVFDLSEVNPGTKVSVVVHHDGTDLVREKTTIGCAAGCPDRTDSKNTDAAQSTDGGSPQMTPIAGQQLELDRAMVSVPPGDLASYTIGLGRADAATVSLGARDVGFEVNATLRDGNGDGTVTLEIDTARLSDPSAALSVGNRSDDVVLHDRSVYLSATVKEGHYPDEYPLAVYPGSDTDGKPREGMLILLASTEGPATGTPSSAGATAGIDLGALAAVAAGGLLGVIGIGFLIGRFGD